MSTTLTIRTDESLREALKERARQRGITLSQAAREILQNELRQQPLGNKTAHLRGRLKLSQAREESWRKTLQERNWRS